MYIEPDSTIKLLKNVPLDASYDHTIYFATVNEQIAYFNSYAKYTFTNQSYQRLNRGWFKVKVKADNIYDCNYIMYQNSAYGNKWFYGFIKTVEYINDVVSQVEFEIDVLQTWNFDYQLGQCFIERQHAKSDGIGENIIPEPVGIGEEMYGSAQDLLAYRFDQVNPRELCIVVAAPFDKNGISSAGGKASNMYSGVDFNIFVDDNNNTAIQKVQTFLEKIRCF